MTDFRRQSTLLHEKRFSPVIVAFTSFQVSVKLEDTIYAIRGLKEMVKAIKGYALPPKMYSQASVVLIDRNHGACLCSAHIVGVLRFQSW